MAQQIHDHFHPTRPMERIDTNGNTPIADGPKEPSIPLREWRQKFGEAMDVLKMRIKASFNSGNGKAVHAAEETANPQGLQNVRKMTKKSAFRSGGYFPGALFNV